MMEKKARGIKVLAASMAMVALGSGAAIAATLHGTNAGEAIYGTQKPDTVHAYGGADLVYGHGGGDLLYGGNEAGWGDKILGGASGDRVIGQKGNDALYGEGGNDRVYGQNGADLVVGGSGSDVLDGGPGADKIDARDGNKDTIVIRAGERDVVYYDRGLDVLRAPASPQSTSARSAQLTAGEAEKTARLSAERPPESLFGHTGKVLVEHEGEELLVAEEDLDEHLDHGGEILDPTGRSGANGGRR